MFKKIIVITFIFLLLVQVGGSVSAEKFKNFTLPDYEGKKFSLTDFKDSKAIVIMFISTQCPVSNAYNERMAKIYEDYKSKGVTFLGINSNKQEKVAEIKAHSQKNNFGFPVLKDKNNIIADVFNASFTPEIYVLNGTFEQLYHGRIDDSRRQKNVKVSDLRNALDQILDGKKVQVAETKAFGCTIKRVNK